MRCKLTFEDSMFWSRIADAHITWTTLPIVYSVESPISEQGEMTLVIPLVADMETKTASVSCNVTIISAQPLHVPLLANFDSYR